MLHKTRGVVLRTIKYGESSIITKVYTEKFGLQSYLVNGVRSSRSRSKASLYQPPAILDLVAYHKEGKNLQRIKESSYHYIYRQLPFDIKRSSISLFITEVLNKAIKDEETHEELFNFIYQWLIFADQQQHGIENLHLYFLINLSAFLGFAPHQNHSAQTSFFDLRDGTYIKDRPAHPNFLEADNAIAFYNLSHVKLDDIAQLKLSHQTRRSLLAGLLNYYELHLENFTEVRSYSILSSILS